MRSATSRPEDLKRARDWAKANPERLRKNVKAWKLANPKRVKEANSRSNIRAKQEALGHYGIDGKAQCRWDGCLIDDLDMLTLDHVENNGAAHRKSRSRMTGLDMYRKMRAQGWPEGYQTLCWNHQWKKEILRRRERALCPE